MSWVDPDSVHNPSAGVIIPAAWFEMVASNIDILLGMADSWRRWDMNVSLAVSYRQEAAFKRVGSVVLAQGTLEFTSAPPVGTPYGFTLPVACDGNQAVGGFLLEDTSTGLTYPGTAVSTSGGPTVGLTAVTSAGQFGSASPVALALGDRVSFNLCYEAAATATTDLEG